MCKMDLKIQNSKVNDRKYCYHQQKLGEVDQNSMILYLMKILAFKCASEFNCIC